MAFNVTDIVLGILQFVCWVACAGALVVAVVQANDRYSQVGAGPWLAVAAVMFAGAIAATIGRVQISMLSELIAMRRIMKDREDREWRDRQP